MCDKCKKNPCKSSPDYWRRMFFEFYAGKTISCGDFDPAYYRGLEGVYA